MIYYSLQGLMWGGLAVTGSPWFACEYSTCPDPQSNVSRERSIEPSASPWPRQHTPPTNNTGLGRREENEHPVAKIRAENVLISSTRFWDEVYWYLEKTMALHPSNLAWKIPWVEEPGRLQSTGSLRVKHDWATSLSLFTFMHWRRRWQPTPAFLPGEAQGRGNLVGCRLWGHTELDTTEAT